MTTWRPVVSRTEPDQPGRPDDSEPRLVERIRAEILGSPGQRITFARYMQLALTEPGLGYYASSDQRPTRAGDFLTAPELHPFFGRCIGRFVAGAWRADGAPARFSVGEHGAGRGTLRETVRAGLSADVSGLAAALDWHVVDLPAEDGVPAERDAPSDPDGVDLAVANEFLDALPVHRVLREDGLRELYVTWRDGWFAELVDEPSTPALAEHLAADEVELAPGQLAEICLAAPAWLARVAGRARLVLVIDYAHPAAELYGPRRMAGSLLTYRAHRVGDDPYAAVGRTDITAHVDLTALERAAAAAGLVEVGSTSQGRFLAALGLGELLADLGRDPATDAATYLAARSAVARLIDPKHLGDFRVIAWARPGTPFVASRLPGLDAEA